MIDYDRERKVRAIAEVLQSEFGDELLEVHVEDRHPRAVVDVGTWRRVAEFLRNDARLHFDLLMCLTAIDDVADHSMVLCYDLRSMGLRQEFAVKVRMDRDAPVAPTVCDLWPTANWHEREAWDLFGITFTGHPELTRILLPDDWEGHPLRKDYRFPESYEGIPMSYEMHWERPTPAASEEPAAEQ